jgi:ABC-type nitrate/sulfonate/bicarbonate transport system substrate-binding protein
LTSKISAAVILAFGVTLLLVQIAPGQAKPDKIRIGYAARAVAHSVPYVGKEAGFFSEEGIDAEIVRTAGSIAPMALVANEVDLAIMSAHLMIPVAVQNRDVVMLGGFSRHSTARRRLRKERALCLAPPGIGRG